MQLLVLTQGTAAEQEVHSAESVNHHLELSVEHTAQAELDIVRIKGHTQVITPVYTCLLEHLHYTWSGIVIVFR